MMMRGFVIGDRGLGTSGDTHPDWITAYAVAGPYLIIGASAIGQLHRVLGASRDDAFVVRAVGPWLSVAVADGVGSRPLSRYGATYVAEALSALLLRPLVSSPKSMDRTASLSSPSPQLDNLAPPPEAETVKLRIGLVEVKPGVASLVAGLKDWTQRLTREESPESADLQVASTIGWWLPKTRTNRPSVSEAHSSQEITSLSADSDREPLEVSEDAPNDYKVDLIEVVRQAFIKTHVGLREHARSLDIELSELGCTALALLLNIETGRGAVGQVGDGAILGMTARGKVLELVQPPDTGEPQTTYTLNKPNFESYLALNAINRASVDPFVTFYVMTDGLSDDLLYSPPEALNEWAQRVDYNLRVSPSPAQAAAGMLNWLATYTVKGSWDDRTLVVITRRERVNCGDSDSFAKQ